MDFLPGGAQFGVGVDAEKIQVPAHGTGEEH